MQIPLSSAILAALLLISACGTAPDPLIGTWSITSVRCNTQENAAATHAGQSISYRSDHSFESAYSTENCADIRLSGTYSRNGLTITETPTQAACGLGCGAEPICAGGAALPSSMRTYVANVPSPSQMEQRRVTPSTTCNESESEMRTFAKQ